MNAMMEIAQGNAQLFITRPFDLFQVKRFVDRIFQNEQHDLRSPRIVPMNNDALKRLLAGDWRKYGRRKVDHVITCLELPLKGKNRVLLSTADILDISEAGMCIRTDSLLRPGHILLFCERSVYCRGVVRWCTTIETDTWHRAGIQFIDMTGAD